METLMKALADNKVML